MNLNGFQIDITASNEQYLFIDVDGFSWPSSAKTKASWWMSIRFISLVSRSLRPTPFIPKSRRKTIPINPQQRKDMT